MFFKIWLTNFIGVMFIAVVSGLGYVFAADGFLAGAAFASLFLITFGFYLLSDIPAGGRAFANAIRSVGLMVLAYCAVQMISLSDAQSFMALTAALLFGWSFQQGYEAAVYAQRAVGHDKLSFPYGFAAWGVIGIVLGPLVLSIVWMSHGHSKLLQDTLRVAKA